MGPYWASSSNLKKTVSSVPAWFRAELGMNIIKQGGGGV